MAQQQKHFIDGFAGAQSLWVTIQMYFQVDNNFVLNRLKVRDAALLRRIHTAAQPRFILETLRRLSCSPSPRSSGSAV